MQTHCVQFVAALEDCNKSLQIIPRYTFALGARGITYLRLGRLDDAINDYNIALSIDSKDDDLLYGRGLAKLKKGDRSGGEADIAAAKAITANISEYYARHNIKP